MQSTLLQGAFLFNIIKRSDYRYKIQTNTEIGQSLM